MDEWNTNRPYDEVYRLRYDGTETRRLTYEDSYKNTPRWTRDGQHILFHDGWSGSGLLHRVSSQATGRRALTDFEIAGFEISPDRQKLAVVARNHDGDPQPVYLMNVDGSQVEHLLTTDIEVSEIQWSPDNKRILFYEHNGLPTIYNIGAGHEESEPLIRTRNARWSPDNRWIAIIGGLDRYRENDEWIDINQTSDDEITNSIHLFDTMTGELKQLVNASDGDVSSVSWSPDSQWLAFTKGSPNAQVHRIRADGSSPQQLTDLNCNAYDVAWSPK